MTPSKIKTVSFIITNFISQWKQSVQATAKVFKFLLLYRLKFNQLGGGTISKYSDESSFPQLYEKPISLFKKESSPRIEEKTNKILNNFSDDFNIIQSMWEDLGVTTSYKNMFTKVAVELENTICKELLEFEISSLTKFANNLTVTI